jgi:hypothetical protein
VGEESRDGEITGATCAGAGAEVDAAADKVAKLITGGLDGAIPDVRNIVRPWPLESLEEANPTAVGDEGFGDPLPPDPYDRMLVILSSGFSIPAEKADKLGLPWTF